jgi:hypothetical protein
MLDLFAAVADFVDGVLYHRLGDALLLSRLIALYVSDKSRRGPCGQRWIQTRQFLVDTILQPE